MHSNRLNIRTLITLLSALVVTAALLSACSLSTPAPSSASIQLAQSACIGVTDVDACQIAYLQTAVQVNQRSTLDTIATSTAQVAQATAVAQSATQAVQATTAAQVAQATAVAATATRAVQATVETGEGFLRLTEQAFIVTNNAQSTQVAFQATAAIQQAQTQARLVELRAEQDWAGLKSFLLQALQVGIILGGTVLAVVLVRMFLRALRLRTQSRVLRDQAGRAMILTEKNKVPPGFEQWHPVMQFLYTLMVSSPELMVMSPGRAAGAIIDSEGGGQPGENLSWNVQADVTKTSIVGETHVGAAHEQANGNGAPPRRTPRPGAGIARLPFPQENGASQHVDVPRLVEIVDANDHRIKPVVIDLDARLDAILDAEEAENDDPID